MFQTPSLGVEQGLTTQGYLFMCGTLHDTPHAHTPTQGALAQLIQFYHRFQKVLSQPPFKPLPIRGELINIHHLMVEVKKHRTSF